MSSPTGSSSGNNVAQKLVGVDELDLDVFSANSSRSASEGPGGDGRPVVVNFPPSANSPLMWPLSLFHSMLLTLSAPASRNWEY